MPGAPSTAARLAPAPRLLDLFERLLDSTPLRLSFYLCLCAYASWGVFRAPRWSGLTQDWQFFEALDEIARQSVLDHHQFPFWNPYWCGGISNIGNPQTTFLTPTFPLVLLFGATLGQRLAILVVLTVACEGGYRLFRFLGMGAAATLLGSVAYPLFGRSIGWFTDGQVGLHGITLATWVLYGWLRGMQQPRYLLVGAAFLAWIVAFRGIQPGPQLALAFGMWAVLLGRERWLLTGSLRQALWPLGSLALLGVVAGGLIGIRVVPVLHTVLSHPRIVEDARMNILTAAWVEILAMPPNTPGYGASGYAYVGRATYFLFLGSFLWSATRRRAAIPLLIAVAFLFITLGDHGEFSPYHQLHRLPLYRSLRNPTLYVFTGALFVVIAGCAALDELDRFLAASRRRGLRLLRVLLPLVALGTAAELAGWIHWFMMGEVYTVGPAPRVHQEFKQARGNHFVAPLWPQLGLGSLDCYDETPWPASRLLRADAPAEEYLADPSSGSVRRLGWSPNRIVLAVELSRPGVLLVNQNWDSGWRSSVGTVRSEQGLLAVDLPAGSHRLELRMLPPLALWGLGWMVATTVGAAWFWRRDRRRERAAEAAAQRSAASVP